MIGWDRSAGRAAAVCVAMLICGASSAHAGRFVIITQPPGGGITPQGGDPYYEFAFHVELAGGGAMQLGDFFKFYDVPGENLNTIVKQPDSSGPLVPQGDFWAPGYETAPNQSPWPGANGEPVDVTNISCTLSEDGPNLGVPISNVSSSDPLLLGTFGFVTYADLSQLPAGYSITFEYAYQAHNAAGGLETGGGTVTLNLVPEPSSIALLALGAAVAVLLPRGRRVQRMER